MRCTKHQPVVRLLSAAFGVLIYASASNAATLSEMGVGGNTAFIGLAAGAIMNVIATPQVAITRRH